MWEYTDKVQEYYKNPKNVGMIEDADLIGEAGSLVCGDALKIYIKLDKDGKIVDSKFQTFGCGSAVAASSALTEILIGKTVEEASKITNQDIVDFLGGLPQQKIHCSVMGKEALEDAIAKYQGTPSSKDPLDRVVCKCFGVSEKKLRQIVQENNIKTVDEATDFCKIGGGCGQCKEDAQRIIDDELNQAFSYVKPPMTKTQMIIKVNDIISNHISEALRKDGGDIELVDVDDNRVYVKLKGTCQSCPGSVNTLKNFVERTLKEQVNPDIQVISV